ncbi:MAG: BatD family protein, partial [Pirellulaceae bacterium]
QKYFTQPQQFVARKSETGDLLFVEIEGDTDRVFVGEPLDLTLKIWLKPYRDRRRNITMSEGDMWQMISRQSSWGSFADRINELAENRQRPGGREVLHDDGQGNQASYYLYEIDATVYPRRPGNIASGDVQIILNYPTALGKSRDPFESMLGDSMFGRDSFGSHSRLSQMMQDEFFASPFRNRVSVSSTRPVVGQASVDETRVLPVPTAGRPVDYQGAVGQYRIVTEAPQTSVNAGDPITLNIGIVGTGPMELVQAPPLAQFPELVAEFKVANEPLAGFVEDNTKVFSTTIRPRNEGVAEIPAIPFSFFDPATEQFRTVMSKPISISVDKADALSLDAIVGNASGRQDSQQDMVAGAQPLLPEFTNDHSANVLISQTSTQSELPWWWLLVAAGPVVWLGMMLFRSRGWWARLGSRFVSARTQSLRRIERAENEAKISAAMIQYIARRTRRPCSSVNSAAGALRACGLPELATQVESFLHGLHAEQFAGMPVESPVKPVHTARDIIHQIDKGLASSRKSRIRRPITAKGKKRRRHRAVHSLALLIVAGTSLFAVGQAMAEEPGGATQRQSNEWVLSSHQQQIMLQEAADIYSQATEIAATDEPGSGHLFEQAARKYKMLIDSGVDNSQLFANLGNAYLQSGQLGHAIASYERARQLDSHDRQLRTNLEFANSLVASQPDSAKALPTGLASRLYRANQDVVKAVGRPALVWTLCIASLVFWGLVIGRTAGWKIPVRRLAVVPMLLMAVALTSVLMTNASTSNKHRTGIVVASSMTLFIGDGEQFDQVHNVRDAEGRRVELLAERGSWTQIATRDGYSGWVESKTVEPIVW